MAKADLKQMLNRVTIQGTLMDNSIENKVDKKGRKYLSGELEVMTDNKLAGAAFWKAGLETADVWDVIVAAMQKLQ